MPYLTIAFAALFLVLAGGSARATAAEAHPPNVLIILADDLGFSDLGCYGGEIETPNLDRLAAGGLRFTQFYNTARCWPTRGALLAGYYAQQIRRDAVPGLKSGGQGQRPAWARLLPELLKPAGYRSYHSGKWHVDGPRLAAGFDRSLSVEDHDRFHGPKTLLVDDKPLPADAPEHRTYVTTAIADHAIACLREHHGEHRARPFFSYVAFTSPHFPLQAPAADIARCRERYRAGWDAVRQARWEKQRALGLPGPLSPVEREVGPPYHNPSALERLGPGEVNRPLAWADLTPEQQQFQSDKMAIHAAMVERMDREIGRILAQLEAMQALDNTLILFLSDNGASAEIMIRGDGHDPQAPPGSAATFLCLGPGWSTVANTPFRMHKTWVHEGGIATPLIVHWPAKIAARGQLRTKAVGHVIDLAPTILELAGLDDRNPIPAAPPRPGRSLQPAFAADAPLARDPIWWLHEGNRALRDGNWKLVSRKSDVAWELYDLATDRAETRNLAAQEPQRVQELESRWLTLRDEFFAQAKVGAPPEPSKKK